MAMVFLTKGGIAYVSEEDEEAVSGFNWNKWALVPSGRPVARSLQYKNKRKFDLLLHRLIAVRMGRDIVHNRSFKVVPIDGDYLNCRRENLAISLLKPKRGIAPRPGGTRTKFETIRRPIREPLEGDLALLWNPAKWRTYPTRKDNHG